MQYYEGIFLLMLLRFGALNKAIKISTLQFPKEP